MISLTAVELRIAETGIMGEHEFAITAVPDSVKGERIVLELCGIRNIRTKSLGSNNKNNVVAATMEGLKQLKTPEEVARLRGKSVAEILG